MKKITLLLLLLSCCTFAQDYQKLNELKLNTPTGTQRTVESAMSLIEGNYRMYASIEFDKEKIYKVVYAPVTLSDAQIEEQKSYKGCLVFDYQIYFDAKDLTLNKPGVKQYRLIKIKGGLPQLFAVWKNWFEPGITIDGLNKKKSATFEDYERQLEFSIKGDSESWEIRNGSSYTLPKDF